jgi:hypothetical protein
LRSGLERANFSYLVNSLNSLDMTLDDHLSIYNSAQSELFDFLGISRHLENHEQTKVSDLHFNHGSGNLDIPTPYPQILDYRNQIWRAAGRGGQRLGDDEALIRVNDNSGWDLGNLIRFNIMSWWTPDFDKSLKVAAVTHLPRPDELHYSQPDMVSVVEQGGTAWGDVCILLLRKEMRG